MIMDYPLWMLWSMECSICGVKIKSDGSVDIGAGSGICVGVGGRERGMAGVARRRIWALGLG